MKGQKIEGYTLIGKLGSSRFATVYKARSQKDDAVALKIFQNQSSEQKIIQQELYILSRKRLKHSNVAKILESSSQERTYPYIVLQLCEQGDMTAYCINNAPNHDERLSFMVGMTRGVVYLHTKNIIHGSLKPSNILITKENDGNVCKITDYGMSKIKTKLYALFPSSRGRDPYMAPEQLVSMVYSEEVDVFCLGLLFFAVFKQTLMEDENGQKSLIPGGRNPGKKTYYLTNELQKTTCTEVFFVSSYFAEHEAIGKLIFDMLAQKSEDRIALADVLAGVSANCTSAKNIQEHGSSLHSLQKQLQENEKRRESIHGELLQKLNEFMYSQNKMQIDQSSGLSNILTVIEGMYCVCKREF